MPKIDLSTVPRKTGSTYPEPYNGQMAGRSSQRVGQAGGLTQFGANLVTLEPNALSALRHWHENEDEFVMVTKGEVTLIDDQGEHPMTVGDCAAFPAGDANGHHFANRSTTVAQFLVVGTKAATEKAHYSDVDMHVEMDAQGYKFTKTDGTVLKETKF